MRLLVREESGQFRELTDRELARFVMLVTDVFDTYAGPVGDGPRRGFAVDEATERVKRMRLEELTR